MGHFLLLYVIQHILKNRNKVEKEKKKEYDLKNNNNKKLIKFTGKLAELACYICLSVNCPLKYKPTSRETNVWDVIHNKHR